MKEFEKWNDLLMSINNNGFDVTFELDTWKNIKDKKFHKLRNEYLQKKGELYNYMDSKFVESMEIEK